MLGVANPNPIEIQREGRKDHSKMRGGDNFSGKNPISGLEKGSVEKRDKCLSDNFSGYFSGQSGKQFIIDLLGGFTKGCHGDFTLFLITNDDYLVAFMDIL